MVKMKEETKQKKSKKEPLWKGPEVDGITQSMLGRFLVCRERFRLKVIEGLEPERTWNHRTGYGDMWHVCEEELAKGLTLVNGWCPALSGALKDHCQSLCHQYRMQQEQIQHWYEVCKVQFPLYVEHWQKHPDVSSRTPLLQEQVFNVPYLLPSGRTVKLRGKWDSVDLVDRGIWLQENKTKGDVKEGQITRQCTFDLQTMFYLIALTQDSPGCWMDEKAGKVLSTKQVKGVRYNVVRRPLSGGKGTIKQHEPSKKNPRGETRESFLGRLNDIIKDSPESFFFRWQVLVTPKDIKTFQQQFLDPILEQVCDWYYWMEWCLDNKADPFEPQPQIVPDTDTEGIISLHWRHPFGVYNAMDEGGSSDLDEYLATGSEVGLTRVDHLFGELQ